MKKILTAAALMVSAAAPLNAQFQQQLCGLAGTVCVGAEFTLTNGGNNLEMRVFNGSTALSSATASRLMAVMVNLPAGFDYGSGFTSYFYNYNGVLQTQTATLFTPSYTLTGDASQTWIDLAAQGANGAGGSSITTCGGPGSPGTLYQTCQRTGATWGNTWDYVVFNWDLNAIMSNDDLALIQWGFRSQSIGPNDNSLKCETDSGLWSEGAGLCDTFDDPFDPPTETTVPEPATMTLLATGLAGMAAVGRRRRKNNA